MSANVNHWDLGDLGASDRPSHLAGRLALGVVTAWVQGMDPRPLRDPAAGLTATDGTLPALAELVGREVPAHHLDLLRHQLGVPNLGIDVDGLMR